MRITIQDGPSNVQIQRSRPLSLNGEVRLAISAFVALGYAPADVYEAFETEGRKGG